MRRLLLIVLVIVTLFLLAVTLTVPVYASTGPAILTVALGALTIFVWRRRRT